MVKSGAGSIGRAFSAMALPKAGFRNDLPQISGCLGCKF